MKRLKSLLPLLVAMVLTVSIMLGSFGIFAFGSTDFNREFFDGQSDNYMVTRVKEGDPFDIPAPAAGVEVAVYDPVGLKAKPAGETTPYKYKASQLGNYKVTYTADDEKNSYSYNVLCYEDRQYFVNVKETAEDFIPTFVKKGDSIKLPKYELAYKNSKGTIVPAPAGSVIDVDFSDDIAGINAARDTITVNKSGTLNITFWGKTGSGTTKKFIKEYTVNVQDDFENKTPPILNTLSVSSTANINALYTLPTASASDSYESNVFIEVKVTDPDGQPVLKYEADDNGYAVVPENQSGLSPVAFDNKEVKTFYPTKLGTYKIQYTAINGYGESQKRSTPHEYTVECRDRLAPQIVEFASDKIPTKWGLNSVSKSDGEDEPKAEDLDSTEFKLPFPVFADNADKQGDLTLTITIVNPANRTLARWDGLVSEYLDAGVKIYSPITYNDYFRTDYQNFVFKPENGEVTFSFDYFDLTTDKYEGKNTKINTDAERYGDWTIKYSVKDTSGNGSAGSAVKTCKVNLSKNYSNINRPEIDENNLDIPKYVLINNEDNTFTIPVIPMKSSEDLDLSLEYTMTSDAEKVTPTVDHDGITYTVETRFDIKRQSVNNTIGGREYPIYEIASVKAGETEPTKRHYILISENNKDIAFLLSDKVEFTFKATDDVGNTFELKDCTTEKIKEAGKIVIDMLYAGGVTQGAFQPDFGGFAPYEVTQKETMNAGRIVIPNIKHVDYTGFEISVLDPDGEPVSFSAYTYNRRNVEGKAANGDDQYHIYIEDLKITPKKELNHNINIRVYDISGKSAVYGFSFNVKKDENHGGTTDDRSQMNLTAAKIESTGTVRTEYELDRVYTVKNIAVENVIVREIKGLAFGIMNNVFIGLDEFSYSINDYVIEDFADFEEQWAVDNEFGNDPAEKWSSKSLNKLHRKSYSVKIENKEKPVIEVHNIIPKYIQTAVTPAKIGEYKDGDFIELPVITGHTKFENAVVEVSVSYKSKEVDGGVRKIYYKDTSITPIDVESNKTFKSKETIDGVEYEYTFSGIFAFAAANDGDYTVKITVKASSGEQETATYVIKVGDRTPVSFTVEPITNAEVNQKFVRTKPVIDGKFSRLTIELKDPNGNKINDASLSLNYDAFSNFSSHEESLYTFADAGAYTIIYTVYNENDDTIKSIKTFTLDVTAGGNTGTRPPVALTTILIIVGALLIFGVIVYVIRFRAVKK